jgi:hypothetical protein
LKYEQTDNIFRKSVGSNRGCECLSLTGELKSKITANHQDFTEIPVISCGFASGMNGAGCGI